MESRKNFRVGSWGKKRIKLSIISDFELGRLECFCSECEEEEVLDLILEFDRDF